MAHRAHVLALPSTARAADPYLLRPFGASATQIVVVEIPEGNGHEYGDTLASAGYGLRAASTPLMAVRLATAERPELVAEHGGLPVLAGIHVALPARVDAVSRVVVILTRPGIAEEISALARTAGLEVHLHRQDRLDGTTSMWDEILEWAPLR